MRQRGEVTRRADGPLRRNDGGDARSEHRLDQSNGLDTDPGGALTEAGELERHHQPDDRDRRGLPHPGGMREDDVALERGEIGALDADAGELAETGVDAIDRLTTRDDALDRRR